MEAAHAGNIRAAVLLGGNLYGSVTTRDAAEAATEAGFTVDRKQVALIDPIDKRATRVRTEVVDGKKVRVAVRSGEHIDQS